MIQLAQKKKRKKESIKHTLKPLKIKIEALNLSKFKFDALN